MVKTVIAWCLLSCFWVLSSVASYKINLSSAWYPHKKSNLLDLLDEQKRYADQHYDMHLTGSKIKAIICPHAGLEYSGNVAAAAYRLLPLHFFKRVIILAPSHYKNFRGVGLPNQQYSSYKNILGTVSLDMQSLTSLALSPLCSFQGRAHELDHSIHMQIPFIQYFCGSDCLILPLLIGDVTQDQSYAIAEMLSHYIDAQTLLVISSDFTHYGHQFAYEPFKHTPDIAQAISQLDSLVVRQIQEQNVQGFHNLLQETQATVCGKNPIQILLALVEKKILGNVETYVVAYDQSASMSKEFDHSVSYVSCVLSQELVSELPLQNRLTGYEKDVLLTIAYQHLYDEINPHKGVNRIFSGLLTKALLQVRGLFVTLYKMGNDGYKQLRGCIGNVIGKQPLWQSVGDLVVQAALHDNRFKPVTIQELPYLDISISVLTDLKKVSSYRDIVLHKDGVLMRYKNSSAVYLPFVAEQEGWNLEQLLSSLSQKAGLSLDSWKKKDIIFETFEAIEFDQNKDPLEFIYEGYKK